MTSDLRQQLKEAVDQARRRWLEADNTCPHCLKWFPPNPQQPRQRYCSANCRKQHRSPLYKRRHREKMRSLA